MTTTVRDIIVDDSDLGIRYSGSRWSTDTTGLNDVGTYGNIYNGTSHGTTSSQSLSFTFNGTAIFAYGTNKQIGYPSNNTYSPGCSCNVDLVRYNSTPVSFDPQNNWLLCTAQNLDPGTHTLIIQVATYGDEFWLDYLRYTPLVENAFSEGETSVIHVKSSDPAIRFGTPNAWDTLQGFTSVEDAKYTSKVGQTMTFSFVGTKVEWYGWLLFSSPHNPASATYTIDSSISGSFDFGNTPTTNITHPNAFFFSTPELSLGPHKLVVTYNGGPSDQPSPLSLGYLLLTGTSITSADVTLPVFSPSSSSLSSGIPSSTNTSSSQAGTSNTPIGAIVGGVVGGLTLIALLLFLLWWWRRRSRTMVTNPLEAEPRRSTLAVVEPFTSMHQQHFPPTSSGKGLPPYSQYDYVPSVSRSNPVAGSSSGSASVWRPGPQLSERFGTPQAQGWGGQDPQSEVLQEVHKPPIGNNIVRV